MQLAIVMKPVGRPLDVGRCADVNCIEISATRVQTTDNTGTMRRKLATPMPTYCTIVYPDGAWKVKQLERVARFYKVASGSSAIGNGGDIDVSEKSREYDSKSSQCRIENRHRS